MRVRSFTGAVSMVTFCSPLSAVPLAPSTGWNVDYGETQCIATRTFGGTAKPVTLAIRPTFTGQTVELLASKPSVISDSPVENEGSVDLGSGKINANALVYHPPESHMAVSRFRLPADAFKKLGDRTVFRLSDGNSSTSLVIDHLSGLKVALGRCLRDLQTYWNYEPSHQRPANITVSARGDVRGIFKGDDYPGFAQARGLEGKASYVLMIDEAGGVKGCDLIEASGIPVLDFMGCEVIKKRAKFTPARDSAGKAVRDTVFTPLVSWSLG